MPAWIIAVLGLLCANLFGGSEPVYLDPSQSIDRRVEDLLARMTLSEKIGQMNMPCVYVRAIGDVPFSPRALTPAGVEAKMAACRRFTEGSDVDGIGPGGGFFTLANTILHQGSRQQALFFNELQKIAIEKTRLKIPLLQTEEGTHGLMCSGGTIFPEGLGIGSTWNMDLVREIYSAAAREARSVGIHQLYTLVIEPNRDPRLGRNEEGFSEDPYLCSRIAEAIVQGAQGENVSANDKVVAGLCHYPGQSEPVDGLEQGAMEVSERKLREVFLPPWVAGIKHAGALGIMATYPAIDGVPTHASEKLLTRILREELGFKGLVLGEGGGISTIVNEHVAATQKEAGELALKAGLDVGISFEPGYMKPLIENVAEGRVSMAMVDQAVRRILRQKFVLGLFDKPYVDPERAVATVHSREHQDLARRVAHEGIVLLKNEKNLLPLDKNIKSIAVLGPNADDARNQLGDYVSATILQDVVTVLGGIKQKVSSGTKVVYARGCEVLGSDKGGFAEAQKAARSADVAIVVVGENERFSPKGGTNGEGQSVASLDLTGVQEDLIKAVYETGTPTVVVLINGRPLSARWTSEKVPAIVEAWLPGEQGGHALADILFGDFNPSGRLPITVARHVGQLPLYYNFGPKRGSLPGGRDRWRNYVDMSGAPLYPFGYGLSYTKFEYSNLQVTPKEIGPAGTLRVRTDVTNAGQRAGEEVVQLYVNDAISSVTRPVIELKGFRKISLKPGDKRTVEFTLSPDELSILDRNLKRVVEPGVFNVLVGSSSEDVRLKGSFLVRN